MTRTVQSLASVDLSAARGRIVDAVVTAPVVAAASLREHEHREERS